MLLLIIYSRYYLHLLLLFSYSVVSDSLQPHGPQHARLPCPPLLKFMPIESVMLSNHLIWYFHLKVRVSRSVVSDSATPWTVDYHSPPSWDFPGKSTGVGCHLSLKSSVYFMGFSGGSDSKKSARNAGDLDSTSGSGRSPGERNGYPLQCSCLENLMHRGARWATVHGVVKSWT